MPIIAKIVVQLIVMQVKDSPWRLDMGANVLPGGVEFRVWAPAAKSVEAELVRGCRAGYCQLLPDAEGVFAAFVPDVGTGTRYRFRLDNGPSYPDPYSRFQPEGVHGQSEVVSPSSYRWNDAAWAGLHPEGLVIYECHVGTYTPEGTFDALAGRLGELKQLGITALELMPVAEFPGRWNWGYDGVDLYAPTRNYGGPEALRRLVDAAHAIGIGVILDVVYNHLGPDGNYLRAYSGSYFTDRYRTPWGDALNYDGEGSKWVRPYAVENSCYWLNEYHVDGLRLDATHAIFDGSPRHIIEEIAERARASVPKGRTVLLVAENENNDVRFIRPSSKGGYGLDAVWADDFHHSVHTLLTGEDEGYYQDYPPSVESIARTIKNGFLYQGDASVHLKRNRGTKVTDEPAQSFVFCIQNHDQIGNRALGDRLSRSVDRESYLVASALLLLSPETPLLFQGQEFAASSPFLFFTDHKPGLGCLVTKGRREEFEDFSAFRDLASRKRIPDPQAESTFRRCKINRAERDSNLGTYRLYQDLIALRKSDPILVRQDRFNLRFEALPPAMIVLHLWDGPEHRLLLANFGPGTRLGFAEHPLIADLAKLPWMVLWHSAAARYGPTQSQPVLLLVGGGVEVEVPEKCALLLGVA